MHKFNELKNKLEQVIENSEFDYTEKENWKNIVTELANYQEEILKSLAVSSCKFENKPLYIRSGIVSADLKTGDNLSYISVLDKIDDPDFPNGNLEIDEPMRNQEEKNDGNWHIIGTAYLDCSYEELVKKCGRNHYYTGKNDSENFEYSLVLKNNILIQERILLELEKYYNLSDLTMYAPMLRRLVFIETKANLKGKLTKMDLQLESNGLSDLKGGWRSVWNIKCEDKPYLIKINDKYRYSKASDYEYVLPIQSDEYKLEISSEYDLDKEEEYISISSYDGENPKNYIQKIIVSNINSQNAYNINESNLKLFITPKEIDNKIIRIYSKFDLKQFLKSYKDFIEYIDVYNKYPDKFKVCTYEKDFEYQLDTEYFELLDRPKLFVEFKKADDYLFYDRVVYMTYLLQKKFPEYIWKGGYFDGEK